jgi:hypothetical protein
MQRIAHACIPEWYLTSTLLVENERFRLTAVSGGTAARGPCLRPISTFGGYAAIGRACFAHPDSRNPRHKANVTRRKQAHPAEPYIPRASRLAPGESSRTVENGSKQLMRVRARRSRAVQVHPTRFNRPLDGPDLYHLAISGRSSLSLSDQEHQTNETRCR